jgi:hypothetical protein
MEGNKKAVAPRWLLLLLLLPKSHTSRENKTLFMIVKNRERESGFKRNQDALCFRSLRTRYPVWMDSCCLLQKINLMWLAVKATAKTNSKQKGYAVSTSFLC